MGKWKSYCLRDVCDFSRDKVAVSTLNLRTYISTENLLQNKGGVTEAASLPKVEATASFDVGDILISNIRPYFKKIWRATFNGGCSNDVLVIRAKKNIEPKFLYYVLSEDKFFDLVTATAKGTKMPRGDKQVIMNYPVPDFPLGTQKKIAAVLSAFDDKIELNNAINKNLEEQAQAIYKNMFVDNFNPAWKSGTLGEFVEVKRGGSPRPIQDYLSDEGLRWLKISDVTALASPYVIKIKEHIKESGLNKTVFLSSGSLVLSNSATPGIPKILDVDTCIHDGWLYFSDSKFSKYFLYLYFKYVKNQLINLGNGSVFTNLKIEIVKSFPVILPDEKTLGRFDEVIAPLFESMKNVAHENKKLGEIRDALLPRLMSGEIDVSAVEI